MLLTFPYCEQYSHNYRTHYFIRRFSLVVSHHQEHKYNKTVRTKKAKDLDRVLDQEIFGPSFVKYIIVSIT